MSEYIKIENGETLAPYYGWKCELRTTLGVCFNLDGILHRGSLCWYQLDLGLDEEQGEIGFSWGMYIAYPSDHRLVVIIN